jgi:hypothetical protein
VKDTADVTGGKPIAVLLQCISGVTAIIPLVAFYEIHGRMLLLQQLKVWKNGMSIDAKHESG